MSTPSPAGRISLPKGKLYRVTILHDKHYPPGHPAQLVFSEDQAAQKWKASFSVPNVGLTEPNHHVKEIEDGQFYQFKFRLDNPTLDQQNAGYIKGEYIFTFKPPGPDPADFGGTVNNPWKKRDDIEDNWTASGGGPDE